MNRRSLLIAVGAALTPGSGLAQGDPIAVAIADPRRPAADREADARRKPAETLAFAQVRPGMKIAELFPGGGYFSRMLSRAAGKDGRVWLVPWQEPRSGRTRTLAADPAYGNFTYVEGKLFGFRRGEPLDLVFTVQNYHDIASPQRAQVNQLIFRWLRP